MPHIESERVAVDFSGEVWILPNCFQLRSEDESVVCPAVVEWLDPKAVANKLKFSFLAIPKSEGKHADEALNSSFEVPAFECRKHDFRVRTATPLVWAELSTYFFEVVDFPVEDDHVTARSGIHRLMTFC